MHLPANWAQVLGRTFDEAVWRQWTRLKAENALLSRHAYASRITLVRNPKANSGDGSRGGIVVVLTPSMKSSEHLVADTGDYGILYMKLTKRATSSSPLFLEAQRVRDPSFPIPNLRSTSRSRSCCNSDQSAFRVTRSMDDTVPQLIASPSPVR
jgi:hypothetical protein